MKTHIECFECDGEGSYDSTYPSCFKPPSECCGGCYDKFCCEYCGGSGEIYAKDDEMNDNIMMLNAYENMLYHFGELKRELRIIEHDVSEDAIATMELCLNKTYHKDLENLNDQINRIEMHKAIIQEHIRDVIDRYNGK